MTNEADGHVIARDGTVHLSAPDKQALIETLAGFDVDGALARLGNMVELYVDVMASFCDEQAAAIDEITAAVDANDNDGAARLAHTLKGLAGTIGATQLETASMELEAALRADPGREALDQLLARCRVELDSAIEKARSLG